ncbi:MAG: pyridoxamine 5'-phosphate oxidase family protein [Clostridiales bacterium]|nr:pyridoxamine 5'-phosphate oxidase family protein [Clostridiales bacterium]
MANVEKVCEFLDKTRTYYLATVDGDQPRVRPFGTVLVYDGKLYIQTGKVKPVSKQLAANPKAEICAFDGQTGTWLRVSGELINDDSRDVKVAMLEKYPDLKAMYNPDDDNTQVLFFKDATATFSSFTAAPEEFTF